MSDKLQDIFNTVVKHLRQQGEQSVDYNGQCQYKTIKPDGKVLKCAAGCLIPDDDYQPKFEGLSLFTSGNATKYFRKKFNAKEMALIRSLQKAHDGPTCSFREDIEKSFVLIAASENLLLEDDV